MFVGITQDAIFQRLPAVGWEFRVLAKSVQHSQDPQ